MNKPYFETKKAVFATLLLVVVLLPTQPVFAESKFDIFSERVKSITLYIGQHILANIFSWFSSKPVIVTMPSSKTDDSVQIKTVRAPILGLSNINTEVLPATTKTITTVVYKNAPDAVTKTELANKLSALEASLRNEISSLPKGNTTPIVYSNNLPAQVIYNPHVPYETRVDQLTGTRLTSITVAGVTGLTDADIPDTITASSYLPLTGGTLSGSLSATDLTVSGNLVVAGAQTLSGVITIPYLVSTTTTNSSFVGNVGIGTTSPYAKLSVVGELVAANFTATSTTALNTFMGSVGIGTTSPYASLALEMTTTNPSFVISNNGSSTPAFYVGGVNQNGFIGIGTSSPSTASDRLALYGGSFFQSVASTTGPGASDQTGMRVVGTTTISGLGGSGITDIVIQDQHVYLVDIVNDKFFIINVSDPNSPRVVSTTTINLGTKTELEVVGHYAYIVTTAGLHVFDISNKAFPRLISTTPGVTIGSFHGFDISGQYAYLGSSGATDFSVIDISNPVSPRIVVDGFSFTEGLLRRLVVSGQYVYIVGGQNILEIIDISNPSSPLVVSTTTISATSVSDIEVSGGYAYISNSSSPSLRVVDISNPSSVQQIGSVNLPYGGGVRVRGRYAYVFSTSGMAVVDIASSTNPINVAEMAGDFSLFDIVGRYGYRMSGSANETLNIIDLSGIEVQSALVHSLEAGSLQTRGNAFISGLLKVTGSGLFGSGILSQGPAGFNIATTTSLSNISALTASISDTNNSSIVDIANLSHTSTSTSGATLPAAGIGAGLLFSSADASWYSTSTSRIASILTSVSTSSPTSALTFSNKNTTSSLSELMRLDSNGNLGLGTTSPYAKLSVVGEVAATNFTATSTSATSTFYGSISIGSSTPSSRFSISQTADTRGGGIWQSATDGDYRATYMDTTGILNFNGGDGGTINTATLNSAGAWTNASDRSYKENIVDLNTKYNLGTILSLNPRFYTMKGSGLPQIGFIAQEVNAFIPEVVDGQEGSMGISYGNLASLSFQGIKDLATLLNIQSTGSTTDSLTAFTSVRLDQIEQKLNELKASQGQNQSVVQTIADWVGNSITAVSGKFKEMISEKIVVENLIVGSSLKPSGITIFSKSGNAFCLTVDDSGTPMSTAGECGTLVTTTTPSTTPANPSDTTAPIITIIGNNPAEIEKGTPYVDLGATVDDDVNHNLGITTIGAEIDTTTVGTYSIIYIATDSAGNSASTTRSVIISDPVVNEASTTSSVIISDPAASEETPPTVE